MMTHISRRGMFRLIAGAAAGTTLLGAAPLRTIAQTIETTTVAATSVLQVNTDLLNLREGAGLAFDIIETLAQGTEVEADAAKRQAADGVNWIYVTVVATGTSGWVDSQYIGDGTESGTAPVPPVAVATKWVSVIDANLRDGAGLTFNILAMLPVGQAVTITGDSAEADGFTWYPVTVNAQSGWMADVVLTDEAPTGFTEGASVTVNTDLLNLRESASSQSPSLGTYAFGTKATILNSEPATVEGANWYQVRVDGDRKEGWFIEEFISPSDDSPTGTITVSDGPLNLRSAPGLAGAIVEELPTGTIVTRIGAGQTAADGYQWINVTLTDQSGREGWIASEFVTFS